MRHSSLFFGMALVPLFAQAETASACTCAPSSIEDEFARSSAVFVGDVVELNRDPYSLWPFNDLRATFRIRKTYKGDVWQQVHVRTSGDGARCGVDFVHGTSYVVWTYLADGGYFATSICSRTKKEADSKDELLWLDAQGD